MIFLTGTGLLRSTSLAYSTLTHVARLAIPQSSAPNSTCDVNAILSWLLIFAPQVPCEWHTTSIYALLMWQQKQNTHTHTWSEYILHVQPELGASAEGQACVLLKLRNPRQDFHK